eukprot:jgi/Hompol1/3928/HPOL_006823-RA
MYYTLAFIVDGGGGSPSWGGSVPVSQSPLYYADHITSLRNAGGDVIVSFGGAIGTELAISVTDASALQAKYQSVIDAYQLSWIDFDIEGSAVADTASNDRRAIALAALKRANPGLRVSFTLPVLPNGLTSDGVNLLKSAVANGLAIDVINIMAMDYGSGVAPNGATGMGEYAKEAAIATHGQAVAAGIANPKIGITPMIGQNDASDEIFRLEDASFLLQFAQQTDWVAWLAFWSVNRDTNVNGPLYASSQIKQNKYDFTNTLKAFTGSAYPALIPLSPSDGVTYKWPARFFAPTIGTTDLPLVDIAQMTTTFGTLHYTLAYIIADPSTSGNQATPSWGGLHPISSLLYLNEITAIR